ncbi:MAG: ABC transporter substrate-binding protein [Candidatus Saccharibacteria bacterium]|nr:ABC transporter substrate-binding protein [Candidatus Saccharibacteria bacterium]
MPNPRKRTKTQKLSRRLAIFGRKASEEGREHIRENLIDRISHVRNIRLLILEWSLLVAVITILAIIQSFWYSDSYAVTAWGRGGTYTEATLGKINSLNPLFANTSSEKTLSKLMFATLSQPDYSGHTGLGLAASIKTDESGLNWTVRLRDNLKWSDGEKITNQDVIYTVNTLKSPGFNSSYTSNLTNVTLTESEDGALVFTLPVAYANFSSALDFPILPAHILSEVSPNLLLENSFSSSPVTSGAFAYNASQTVGNNGERIVYLVPNKEYYRGAPMLDSFAVHAYTSSEEIVSALRSGTVTATAELLPTDAENVTSSLVNQRETAISSGVFFFLNTRDSIFSNKNLRKSLQKGIDMRSLRAPLGDEITLDYPLTPTQINITNYPALPTYDPESAKATVSTLSEGDRTIRLATTNSSYFPALAENLKYQLEQLGFRVDVQIYTPNQDFLLTVLRPRDYDILLYEIELGADPDLFAYYHSSQATETGLNLSNYTNSLASDLLLAARSTMDPAVRSTKYQSFLNYWVEDVPAIGIYQVNFSYYVNRNVRSYSTDNHLVSALDRFIDVERWATEKVSKNRTP